LLKISDVGARVADTAEGYVVADIPDRGAATDDSVVEGAIGKAKRDSVVAQLTAARPAAPSGDSPPTRAKRTQGSRRVSRLER
jgi:hypothetical protein